MADAQVCGDKISNEINTVETDTKSDVQTSSMSREEKRRRLKERLDKARAKVNNHFDELQEKMDEKANDPNTSEAEYDEYSTKMEPVIENLGDLIGELFEKLSNFIAELWEWLKKSVQFVLQKVENFFSETKQFFKAGFRKFCSWFS